MTTAFAKPGPTLTENDIAGLETRINAHLPGDYRGFLLTTNGGKPADRFVPEPDQGLLIEIEAFFAVGTTGYGSMEQALDTWADRYPADALPIALCAGSNLLLLSVGGDDIGRVGYWDHDGEADENEAPRTDNITPVAGSFTELLALLQDWDPSTDPMVQDLLDGAQTWANPNFKPKFD